MIAQVPCLLLCTKEVATLYILWGLSYIELHTGFHFQWCATNITLDFCQHCIFSFFTWSQILWFSWQAPDKRAKCAEFIKKCFEFLEEPEHLVTLHLGVIRQYQF